MVYLGVDLHRKISHVVALDEAGSTILSRRFEHSPHTFRRVFGELAPEPISVAFEATYGWGWFADVIAMRPMSEWSRHRVEFFATPT